MFAKASIRLRLIATMSLLGLLIVIVGISGLYGMKSGNNALRDVNTNTMPSAMAITSSQIALGRARLALDRVTMHPDAADADKTLSRARKFLAESDQAWAAYLALPQGPEEKRLSDDLDVKRKKIMTQAFEPLFNALNAKDGAAADAIIMKLMQPLFVSVNDSAATLAEFQSRANVEQYEASQALYGKMLWLTMGVIGVGVLTIVLALYSLLRSILGPIHAAIGHFTHIAEGNLSNPVRADGHDEMAQLLKAVAAMQNKLASTVRSVRDGTVSIAAATGEIADGNLDLSRRTEQQAASLEETASSLEQLTATVRQNSENARQSNQLAHAASDIAVKGGAIVADVVSTMEAIRASSTRIEDIIGVIDGIAFQTNILALNAAVEAARAGEQGRGFAVVASEVRSLAHRSAEAAKDIKNLIGDSVAKVDSGGRLVGQAGATMGDIVASIRRVTDIMGEISAAGQEQEIGIGQINRAVAELDAVTQQNAALVEQAAAASESMKEQAEKLNAVVGSFVLDDQAASPARMGAGRALALGR